MAHVRKHMVGKFCLLLFSHTYNFPLFFGVFYALDWAGYEKQVTFDLLKLNATCLQ